MTTLRPALFSLAAVALLSLLSATPTSAHEPHPGVNFLIGIDGVRDCNTRNGDANCAVPPGSTFLVEVQLDRLPKDVANYGGFDIYIEYAGVTPLRDADISVWPDCGFPHSFYGQGFVALGCAMGLPPAGPSTYFGTVATNSFVCERSGSVTLVHGASVRTDLLEKQGYSIHAEGSEARETIKITCGEAPTPTAPAGPGLPSTGQSANDSPFTAGWLMAALLALGGMVLLCMALRVRLSQK